MNSKSPSYRGYRFPPEIISHAVLFLVIIDPGGDRPATRSEKRRRNEAQSLRGDTGLTQGPNLWGSHGRARSHERQKLRATRGALNDVAPDGAVTRVTYGALNLA